MSNSSRLALPYLAAGQAQKHVTVNESLLRLDALTQLSAISATVSAEPAAPTDGDIYLLPAGKTGAAWGAFADGALAYWRDGVWEELTPKPGWRCFVEDEAAYYARTFAGWAKLAAADERRLIFTPGGDGVVSIYRCDTARVQNPRTVAIASIAGDTITLTSADAGLFFAQTYMADVSYVRIWNVSKTPNQPAWIKASPAADQLTVLDAAAISSWSAADTIHLGDPLDQTPGRVIALDISPMMQTVLGRVFRQKGVLVKGFVEGLGVQAVLDTSEDGLPGSFNGVRSETSGGRLSGQLTQVTSVQSPLSETNLVFVREAASGAGMGIALLSVLGLWV
ncbi:MAG TPA: DUF2793 domain-containing protein [Vitreimonas sp.]|uniref:DUF2793 domain-containing protein n=1 Tax=Vitreimonas sp. TaxID=3069702 RepID=UPI002D4BDECC|nr:DUF2793 domain-containing protein [Vitreimonas sp.]HYD87728.1 DUF2793 domain-containing protein [Vitreimonas sp.]